MRKLTYIIAILLFGLTGCRHIEDVAYFQPKDSTRSERKVVYPNFQDRNKVLPPSYEYQIQSNDILSIYVSSLSPEASSFFNAIAPIERNEQTTNASYTTRTDIGYLVDGYGMIELPLVGKVKVGGLSTSAAKDTLTKRLEKFLQYPSVRIYIENFRVTILGEVYRPGVYTVTNEKITLPEAIGLAGDLNIFANRKEITLIREENGEKKYITIDITKRDLFNAPYYYLHSGDIIYVAPVNGKIAQSDNAYRVIPIVVSTLTLIAVLATRFFN
ncbi:MAG: polysaccharide biosynthesis/export family protein [Bacteroidia bacterium]